MITLPLRTVVTIQTTADRASEIREKVAGGEPMRTVLVPDDVAAYRCVDCGYETTLLEHMEHHQKHARHSWKVTRRRLVSRLRIRVRLRTPWRYARAGDVFLDAFWAAYAAIGPVLWFYDKKAPWYLGAAVILVVAYAVWRVACRMLQAWAWTTTDIMDEAFNDMRGESDESV